MVERNIIIITLLCFAAVLISILFIPEETNCPPSQAVPTEQVTPQLSVPPETQRPATVTLDAPEPSRGVSEIFMTATGYCDCYKCCGKHPGDPGYRLTASGVLTNPLTVSADWSVLPKGTEIYIEGLGRRIVQDRGGAIAGNRLDVWFPSHAEALAFGVRTVKVRVLD